jgi:hypothetical protein
MNFKSTIQFGLFSRKSGPDGKKEDLPPRFQKEEDPAEDSGSSLKSDLLRFKSYCYFRLGDYDISAVALKQCAGIDKRNEVDLKRTMKDIWKNKVNPSL